MTSGVQDGTVDRGATVQHADGVVPGGIIMVIQQIFMAQRYKPYRRTFRTPFLYNWVRHPIYSGFLLAFWASPVMTYGHLLLAVGFSAYIFIGIAHEERDLVGTFGQHYTDYRKRVGAVIPGIGRRA